MSEGKNIEIKIAATGGDQAAAEVSKPAEAIAKTAEEITKATEEAAAASAELYREMRENDEKYRQSIVDGWNKNGTNPYAAPATSAPTSATTGSPGMLDAVLPERAEEATAAIKELEKGSEKLAVGMAAVAKSTTAGTAAMEDYAEKADTTSPKLDKIINIQRAQVANQIAQGLGAIAAKVKEAAAGFAEADPEFATALNNLSEGLETATGAMSGAAQGFAVGGPFGAAVGGLIGGAVTPLKSALDDMTSSLAKASVAEATAATQAEKLAAMQAMGADAYAQASEAAEELTQVIHDGTEAIDAQVNALERRNKILNADESAYKAKRDRSDAAEIRNGAEPENVKIRRAQDDGAIALQRVDREEEAKKAGLREAGNAVVKAQLETDLIRTAPAGTPGATPEALAEAEAKLKALKEKVKKMTEEAEDASRIAQSKRTEINERTAGKVEELAGNRTERRGREAQKIQEEAAAAKADAERQRNAEAKADAAQAQRSEREAGSRNAGAAQAGREAERLLPKGVSEEFAKSVQKAAQGLQNGDQGGELKKLVELMHQLADAAHVKGTKTATDIAALEQKIAVLTNQRKNNR